MRVSNWLAGMLAGMLAAGALAGPDYVQFDAEQLKSSPQSGWARPILFTDSVAAAVGEASKKLDRKFYAELTLATVGAAWVPEADLARFQGLAVGKTYSFGGTVDQIRGRYYVILDAVFELQTQEALEQQWTGLAGNGSATTNDPVVQALLIESQNRLIRMAQENNMTVAELVGAQTDGGHRIVENIVADSLQAQLQANNQTAEQVMVDAVMALLQKQAALEGVADVAENAALPSPDQIEQLLDQGQASGTQADDEDALFVETDDEPAVEAPSEDWWKGVGEEILAMPQSPEVPATPEPTAVEVELPAIDVAVAEGETGEGTSESAETEGTPEAAAGSADDLLADLVPSLDQEPAAGEDEAVVELPEAGDMAGSEVAEVPLDVPAETAAANEPGEQVESVAEPVEPFEPVATAEVAGDTKLAGDEVAAMLPPTVDVAPAEVSEQDLAMNAEVPGKGRLVPAIDSGLVRPLDGVALVPMVSAMPTEAELAESARLAREQAAAAKAEAKRLEKEAEEEAKRLEKERRAAEKEAQRIEREARRAEEELREREEEARKAAEKEAARKLREAQREAEKRQEALEEALAEQQAAAVDAAKQSARLESSRAALAALREENARQMAELEVRRATAEAALVAASNTTAEAIAKAQAAVEAASQQQLSQLEADTTATLAALQQQLTEAAAISDEELAAANATMAQLEEGRALADQEAEQLAEARQAAKAAEAAARDAEKAAEQAVKDAAKTEREARQKAEKELRAQAEAAEKAAKKAEEEAAAAEKVVREAAEAEQRASAETEPAAEEKGWFARWSERRAAAAAEKAARRAEEEAREAEEEAREKAEKERRAAEKALRKEEERQRKEAEKQRKEEEKRLQEEEKARLAAEKAAAARAVAASGDFGDIYAPVEW